MTHVTLNIGRPAKRVAHTPVVLMMQMSLFHLAMVTSCPEDRDPQSARCPVTPEAAREK